uniref:TLC domain-containing protein n=1 Tax=viral metagenome TaxID=1070528 RepID=A0A6C0I596_9ZZZZ
MNLDLILPIITNIYLYNNIYSSIYNCSIITICTFIKLIFYNNYFAHKILEFGLLNSILYYTIDTIKILYENKKINAYVIHHICACNLFINKYIFNYDVYNFYLMVFLMESSSIFYNLNYFKFINYKLHVYTYVPLRFLCNLIFLYFIMYENKFTYYTELIIDIITYTLLFIFNVVAIYKNI